MTIEPAPREHALRVVMLIPYDLEYQPFTIRTAMFASELVKRGYRVNIFHRRMRKSRRGNRVPSSLPEGCDVRDVPGILHPRAWRQMAQALRAADVVHFQKSLPPTTQDAIVLGRWFGKPVHQDWDDFEFAFWLQAARDAWQSDGSVLGRVRKAVPAVLKSLATGSMERIIPIAVDTVGGASMFLRRKSIEWGADPSDVFPARVGVDAKCFSPERRSDELRTRLGLTGPTVLFAGSFDIQPDLLFFAESLRTLFREAPEAQCLIVGGGFGRNRLLEVLGIDARPGAIVMTDGLIARADMPRYVASCDFAALPFRDTPVNRSKSSLTLLESMASGLACVTHDVGDVGWMLGEGGVVAPAGDPEAFGKALATLAKDSTRRQELGRKARQRALERFTWEASVDHLEAAYMRARAKRARTSR
jgi:glycosyltransferase involved in cell wall biosynthesis